MNIRILYPPDTDFSSRKTEIIQKADKIYQKTTFSNGLIIEPEQDAESADFRCNRELKTLPNGNVQIL